MEPVEPSASTWDPIAYLEALHTKQLMNLRNDCYRYEHDGVFIDCTGGTQWITVEQVNQVLSTREHIPNKAEAKLIRQQKAQAARNR